MKQGQELSINSAISLIKVVWQLLDPKRRTSFLNFSILAVVSPLLELLTLAFLYEVIRFLTEKEEGKIITLAFKLIGSGNNAEIVFVFFGILVVSLSARAMLMRLTATISHGVAADVSTKMFENLASSLKLDTSLQIERDEFTAQISTKALLLAEKFVAPMLHLIAIVLVASSITSYLLYIAMVETLTLLIIGMGYYLVVVLITANRLTAYGKISDKETTSVINQVNGLVGAPREYVTYGIIDRSIDDFRQTASSLAQAHGLAHYISMMPRILLEGILIAGLVSLCFAIFNGSISFKSELLIVLVAIMRLVPLFQQVYFMVASMQNGWPTVIGVREAILELPKPEKLAQTYHLRDSMELCGAKLPFCKPSSDGLNYKFHVGNIISLTGQSGVGKTTLCSVLMGCVPLEQGQIKIDGKSAGSIVNDGWRALAAVVPQSPSLHVLEHYLSGKRTARSDFSVLEFRKNLAELGIEWSPSDLIKKIQLNRTISGGENKRVALAFAFAFSGSRLVVLDEFTAGLDAEARNMAWELVKKKAANKIVVCVTHIESDLAECDVHLSL